MSLKAQTNISSTLYKRIFDLLVPDSLRKDIIQANYAKILIILSMTTNVIGAYSLSVNLYFADYLAVTIVFILLFVVNSSILIMHHTGKIFIARETITLAFFLLAVIFTLYRNSIYLPTSYWIILAPIICLLCGGFRSSIIWFLLSCSFIIFI